MKARKNIVIIIFLSLFFTVPAKGDDMANAIETKVELQKKLDELQQQLTEVNAQAENLNGLIKLKKDTILSLNNKIKDVADQSNVIMMKLKKEEELMENLKKSNSTISTLEKAKSEKEKESDNLSANINSLGQYASDVEKADYEANKALMKNNYSQLSSQQLNDLQKSLVTYKSMPDYKEYEKAVNWVVAINDLKDKGNKLLSSRYDNLLINRWLDDYISKRKENCPSLIDCESKTSVDSLRTKLVRYKNAVLNFKEIINDIDNISKDNTKTISDKKNVINEYFKKEEVVKFEDYYIKYMIWLREKYFEYKTQISRNPNANCQKLKDEILNIEIK